MLYPRVLRRRWVLAVIFVCSLLYFLSATLSKSSDYILTEYESKRTLRQPFQWQPPEDSNDTETVKCRNSRQGRFLIVDQKGYVCKREAVGINNCCNPKHLSSKLHACDTCLSNGCCSVYEHCVSCCLQPRNQPLLSKILNKNLEAPYNLFVTEVENPFDLCLAKCRTSSQSVQHENSYRDAHIKYCYGESAPDLQIIVS
ncbi:SREBP regulating gene protein [Aplysia californica]|uniref:SREBP regulating gene protein n=1 Tax=Aplysia californica TaxID=6500 RepID=A0ABM0K4L1_APLCA|nr:SREBP regulating gene protein [Aplysia californica]